MSVYVHTFWDLGYPIIHLVELTKVLLKLTSMGLKFATVI